MACLCAGVTRAELVQAIAADAQATVESLGDALGCGTQCGSCLPLLKEALGEQAWFGAVATARPLTRARDLQGVARLIYRVEIAIDGERPYPRVLPGQHVVLRANVDGVLVERTYTVVAQDMVRRRLTVAIRRKPDGALTPWLLGEEGADRIIEVSAPGGPGLGNGGYRSAVFFAGGVGVTPAVAMVNALGASASLHLDYSVADRDDAAFLARFEARARERPGFTYAVRETSVSGPIRERDVRRLVQLHPAARFYICGPEGFVQTVRRALRKCRIDGARVHVEQFALQAARRPARTFRFKAYVAGACMSALPVFALLPELESFRPHGHPNVGHEQLKCVDCHVDAGATTRQTLQAKVKHAIGWRQTGAVLGMRPVGNATCVQCHANPDDRHTPHRFLEPRFDEARAATGAQLCVSCHREHSGTRVTLADARFCASCHAEMKAKDDRIVPTHDHLVANKRWETCLQCHDYHGNHRGHAPQRLVDAASVETLNRYLAGGPSPYGSPVRKAIEGGAR